jgi:hypothetical protein
MREDQANTNHRDTILRFISMDCGDLLSVRAFQE